MKTPSVFLSSVNAAYPVAREIYQFLRDRELAVFFCDEALLRTGDAFYRPAMERALRQATHLLVVLDHPDQAGNALVLDALRQFSQGPGGAGRLVTLLAPGISPSELPLALQRGRVFGHPDQWEALYHGIMSPEPANGAPPPPDESDLEPMAAKVPRRRKPLASKLSALLNLLLLVLLGWMWHRQGNYAPKPTPAPPPIAGLATPESDTAGIPLQMIHPPGARYSLQIRGTPQVFSYIPPGSFLMGSPLAESGRQADEQQQRVMIRQGFWMAQTECTQKLWEAVMGSNPATQAHAPELPVDSVSWNDIAAGNESFLGRLNALKVLPEGWRFALPDEAQWEYACRADTVTPFSFGAVLDGTQANGDGHLPYGTPAEGFFAGRPLPVGSYPPNPWGLYDMHGNLKEWCDWRDPKQPAGPQFEANPDPDARPEARKIERGGSWRYHAGLCRSAVRGEAGAATADDTLGFRFVIVAMN